MDAQIPIVAKNSAGRERQVRLFPVTGEVAARITDGHGQAGRGAQRSIATGARGCSTEPPGREFGIVKVTRVPSRVSRYVAGPEIVMYAATGAATPNTTTAPSAPSNRHLSLERPRRVGVIIAPNFWGIYSIIASPTRAMTGTTWLPHSGFFMVQGTVWREAVIVCFSLGKRAGCLLSQGFGQVV